MPELASPRWRAAVDQVRGRLKDILDVEPTPLDQRALAAYHHRFKIVTGWRIPIDFGEPELRQIDVLIPSGFPSSRPQFGLVERPPFLTWPHIERDGSLCLLANMSEIDVDDPVGVVERLLGKSCALVENLLDGAMIERDFRDEFLTYWRYDRNAADGRLTSILKLERPARGISVWQAPNIRLLGETEVQLSEWLRNRYGPDALRRSRFERGLLLWLDVPLLPAEYPRTARDVLGLAERYGGEAPALLADLVSERQDNLIVALAAEGRFGPGVVSVTIPTPRDPRRSRGRSAAPLFDGFRSSHLPDGVLARRYLGTTKVLRDEPKRADAPWVHGRGHDPRSELMMASTVTILGCGSVGAPVAVALAQSGVGRLNLVDHDELNWANVGRHPLGASSVRANKAEAMAAKLRVDYPHGQFEAFPVSAQTMLASHEACLGQSNIIVSCMGDWRGESRLNDWHCRRGRPMPVVYGWTEAHAAAGHAVAITHEGGCLRCGLGRTGAPDFQVLAWPDGAGDTFEEPACGAHYQPYGPIELGFTTSLIAQFALDCLLGKVARSSQRIYAARRASLDGLGALWSDGWIAEYPSYLEGGVVVDRAWPINRCCTCSEPVIKLDASEPIDAGRLDLGERRPSPC